MKTKIHFHLFMSLVLIPVLKCTRFRNDWPLSTVAIDKLNGEQILERRNKSLMAAL